jgi:hypothetical protein
MGEVLYSLTSGYFNGTTRPYSPETQFFQTVVRGGPQEVSEEKVLQKFYQTLNE